jgi:tripartite ATP-independent transporter DctM subunit
MTATAAAVIGLLVLFLGAGVWVSLGLIAVGIGGLEIFRNIPIERQLSISLWNTVTSETLIALPLFILMAEVLFRTQLSASLFRGLAPWAVFLPGRLMHVNVLGCTMFAAISGSSAATAATVGRITLSELFSRGYDRRLTMGSLAGAGTLGFLIPPSVIMIIYGVLSETSVLKLFIAGVLPGLLLALSYMAYIAVRAMLDRSLAETEEARFSWRERLISLISLGPVVFLILLVLGSMYGGIASPTEAAAVGVLGAVIISALQGTLTWHSIQAAAVSAVRTSSMVGLIVAAAVFLSQAMAFLGVPRAVAEQIAALNLSAFELIALLLVFYVALGCVLEGMSAIVMTLPITLPLVLSVGYDKIWFGVFLVLVVEMAQITPPVGFNLFVIQSLTGEKIGVVAKAALPFFIIMALFTLLVALVPEIATFLPSTVMLRG